MPQKKDFLKERLINATLNMEKKSNTKEMTTKQILIAFGLVLIAVVIQHYAESVWQYLFAVLILLADVAWIASGAKKGG